LNNGFNNNNLTRNLLKAQQRIIKTQKDIHLSSEKSRHIKILKSSTSKRDRGILEIEKQIHTLNASQTFESRIKVLIDSFKHLINTSLAESSPDICATLTLINDEFSSLFKKQKSGYEQMLNEHKSESEEKFMKFKRSEDARRKALEASLNNVKKEVDDVKRRYEVENKELTKKIKENTEVVFK
jgi:hypothetical protein